MANADGCPDCQGVGVFRSRAAYGEAGYGRAEQCPTCAGYGSLSEALLALREGSSVPPAQWERCTFAHYDRQRTPQAGTAYDAAQRWTAPPETPGYRPFVLLAGSSGLGKTHLAVAAVRALVERRQRAWFVTLPRLLDELRATQREGARWDLLAVRHAYESVPYLVLDDLGADRVTDFAQEQVYLVIDYRWQRRLPLLVTSNADEAAIEPRVRSRILDSHLARVVVLTGMDQRRAGGDA